MRRISTHHGEEETELWVEIHNITIGEDKLCLSFLLGHENDGNLLSSHRQHRKLDTIELVKASP